MDSRPEMYPGGDMSAVEYYRAEMAHTGDNPEFLMYGVDTAEIGYNGEDITIHRGNTGVYLFNNIELEGLTLNYESLDHVFIAAEPPHYIFRPEDQESENHERWENLVKLAGRLGCNVTHGLPMQSDLETQYKAYRGDMTVEYGIEDILNSDTK
jgi:hypothetical protein